MHSLTEYSNKNYWICRVDSRVKLVVTFVLLVMILTYKGFTFPLLMFFLCLMLCFRIKIPLNTFVLRFSEPAFIAFVLLVLKLFFSGHDVLFHINLYSVSVTGYRDGLMTGLAMVGRIIGAVSVVVTLGFTTQFAEIMAALSWFRIPKSFVEISMFALRYIFVLIDDATVIYSAQKNRLGYSSIKRGLKSFGTLAGSLTLKAFEHSQNLTTAMVQRGYDGYIPLPETLPLKHTDIIVSILFLILMGAAWRI
ncbi:MAG: cobalt ECF transporter T component CbiQ [Nitrospirae bacterium]|nr:cobalt ECF transporter T component CbiQ [Nitrospirota bacterium]